MTAVTNELMFEVLKKVQERIERIDENMRIVGNEMQAIRQHQAAQSREISNIYDKLVGHELRLERIERRLDLISEPAHS